MNFKFSDYVSENAMGGAIGAGSIANKERTRQDLRVTDYKLADEIKKKSNGDQFAAKRELEKAKKLLNAKKRKQSLFARIGAFGHKMLRHNIGECYKLNESFDLNDVVSRLKGIETKAYDYSDTVTYGVEDEKGNLMKITVKAEQSSDFENEMGQQLAQVEKFKKTGYEGMDTSLGELVYNLRSKFEIIDLEFPTIPTDVIYNVKQAQTSNQLKPNSSSMDDFDQFDSTSNGESDGMGDGMDQMDDGFGDDSMNDDSLDPSLGDSEGDPNDIIGDDESVEDFAEPNSDSSPETLLQNVLAMLTAQANASIAQANAEAEKARALQAEYTAKATAAGVSQQEELMRMELAQEEQKRKAKEAKRLADLARFRVDTSANMATPQTFESFKIGLNALHEIEMFATPQSLGRERSAIMMQFQIEPTDDAETKKYKQLMKAKALQALNVNLQQAQLQQKYKRGQQQVAKQQQQQQQQQQPNQPMQANNAQLGNNNVGNR